MSQSQAQRKRKPKAHTPVNFLVSHFRAFISSVGKLIRAPFSSLLTILVIAIALALPMSLFVLLQNAKTLSQGWDKGSQISLYLSINTQPEDIERIIDSLKLRNDIAYVEYISPEQGLKDFREQSGFGDAVNHLPENPLPPVIEVYPENNKHSAEVVENLVRDLQQIPNVETAQLDMQWVKRLYSIISLGQRGFYGLLLLFSLAVILIVGNTIRLLTQNQRDEIEVIKLIGGTNAFIRRPFLYTGILYGFCGGLIAWLMIDSQLLWLHKPIQQLATSYGSQFQLIGISMKQGILLSAVGTLLGFCGSWITAHRQIASFDPS